MKTIKELLLQSFKLEYILDIFYHICATMQDNLPDPGMCKIKKLPEMLFYRSSERLKTPHLTSRVFTVNLEGSLGLYNVCHTYLQHCN